MHFCKKTLFALVCSSFGLSFTNEAAHTFSLQNSDIESLFDLGKNSASKGRLIEAINFYKEALYLEPDRIDIEVMLAYAYLENGKLISSRKHFLSVLDKEPNNVDALLGIGQFEVQSKHYERAKKYFNKALDIDPSDIHVRANLDTLSPQNQEIQLKSKNQGAKVRSAKLKNKSSEESAIILIKQKQYQEAAEIYENLLADYPEEPDYLFALGKIYAKMDRLKETIELYKRALTFDPERNDIKGHLAYAYFREGDLVSSKEIFEALLIKDPNDIDILLGIGQIEIANKHFAEGKKYFDRVKTLDPENITALFNLSSLQILSLQNTEIQEIREKLIDIDSQEKQVKTDGTSQKKITEKQENELLEWAKALIKQGRTREAAAVYEDLIALSPNNVDYYLLLGTTYVKMQCYSHAIVIYTLGLNLKPCNIDMRNALAYAYLRKGTFSQKAWPHFQWFWNYPYMFYFIKEDIYPRENKREVRTSRELFADVLEQEPENAPALTGFGRTELILNDNKEAAESIYSQSLDIEPDNTTTLAYYAALLASEGRYFSARARYEELLEIEPDNSDIQEDYQDVLDRSNPTISPIAFYSQENEQDLVTAIKKEWTVRLFNYGGGIAGSLALQDRVKLSGIVFNEYIALKNLINETKIYSLDMKKCGLGVSWRATPYISVAAGLELTYFSQYLKSSFFTKSGCFVQPSLNVAYNQNHHSLFIETTSDTQVVARNFTNNKSTLVDRQYLRGLYEYNFGNRTVIGATAANIWYIGRIKGNQQQIASTWFQYGVPCFWQNIVLRYQFIYGHFNRLTSDYYTYRFQTTHWTNLALSKNWFNNKLITEAGYGHAWQRGFEQGQIIVVNPVSVFQIINREINAVYARTEYNPYENIKFTATGTYTRDSFNYTTAGVTGKLDWRY